MTIKSWESRTTPNTTLGEQLVLMQAEINELRAALAERDGITHESEEQLRLNSIGAEREYVLLGKVAQLERERDKLWAEIANLKAQLKSELASHESWQNEHLRIDGEQCHQIRELEAKCDAMRATLRAVLVDAQAQDVLFEWWAVIGHFLDPDDPFRSRIVTDGGGTK